MTTREEKKTAVRNSREQRARMENYFGFIPISVLEIPRKARRWTSLYYYQKEKNRTIQNTASKEKEFGLKCLSTSGCKAGRGTDGLSIMQPQIVEFFIKYYMQKGMLYIDPFAGQGIRMQVAAALDVNYVGFDVARHFVAFNKAVRSKMKLASGQRVEIHKRDSRKTKLDDSVGDFCFTSPPYFNIEDYGNDRGQLGKLPSYSDFMQGVSDVARELSRVLKPNAFAVINVNDFTVDKIFYSYHSDTIHAFTSAGFVSHDCWILLGGLTGMARVFAVSSNARRRAPKVHEFALVFRNAK